MGRSYPQEYFERSFYLPMIGAVSPGIFIPSAGALVPHRRFQPPKFVPKVEVLSPEAGLGRGQEGDAYLYDRQGFLYDPKNKGLLMDAYY
jgi:hypothetical protein